MTYISTLLAQIADKKDSKDIEKEIQKADLDLLKKINEVSEGGSSVISPLKSVPNGNVIYPLPNGTGSYTVFIPSPYLVASFGGPYTLTLKTTAGNTVVVPIAALDDTLLSGGLLFNVYFDSSGNIAADAFEISGSNANGSWIKFGDGTMEQWGTYQATLVLSGAVQAVSSPYPLTFYSVGFSQVQCWPIGTWSGFSNVSSGPGNPPSLTQGQGEVLNSVMAQNVYVTFHAIGRWKA
jgi:hypothetical protein